jgi:hypothetical protein
MGRWGWRGALASIAVSGCAVQSGPGQQAVIGLDAAELVGQTVAKFTLSDGSEGRLRVLNGAYSLKLQRYLKVIPVEQAQVARLVAAQAVGAQTLVVVEKGTSSCPYKTQLYAIQGREVLGWDFGDCQTKPEMRLGPDEATFDFVQGRRTTRFTFKESRLLRGDFATPTEPALAAPSTPLPAGPRHVPGPPVSAASLGLTGTAAPPATAPRPAPTAAPVPAPAPVARAPAPPPAPVFTAQEQKPIRIVLDK